MFHAVTDPSGAGRGQAMKWWKREELEWRLRSYWGASAMRMFIAIWGVLMLLALMVLFLDIPI